MARSFSRSPCATHGNGPAMWCGGFNHIGVGNRQEDWAQHSETHDYLFIHSTWKAYIKDFQHLTPTARIHFLGVTKRHRRPCTVSVLYANYKYVIASQLVMAVYQKKYKRAQINLLTVIARADLNQRTCITVVSVICKDYIYVNLLHVSCIS